jgi:hypothetical protein
VWDEIGVKGRRGGRSLEGRGKGRRKEEGKEEGKGKEGRREGAGNALVLNFEILFLVTFGFEILVENENLLIECWSSCTLGERLDTDCGVFAPRRCGSG